VTAPLLSLDGIRKRFGPTVALDGVSVELAAGQVHALIGENGAGKSTLMNILAGALAPDEGGMTLAGAPYVPSSPHDASLRGVALIHQELSLCPHLTVAENILLGREPSRHGIFRRTEAERLALDVLGSFSHPELKPNRIVGRLPIAAQQVVEICRAVAARSRIVLMDEPTSSLQRDDVEHLFALVRRLRGEGIGIVYISHFLEEVRAIADVFTVLRDGKSVAHGPIGSTSNETLVAHMVGRSVDQLFPVRGARTEGSVVLDVKGLVAPPVVKEASFTLRRGEILGIAGLMGSGRTELVRALFGLAPVASGAVAIAASPALLADAPSKRIAQRVGYLSEDRKGEGLALPMSVADNLTMTGFSACAPRGWLSLGTQRAQTRTWIGELGIKAHDPDQPVRTLSGGNQQKVALGRLMYQDADILLLDEPTRGVDIGSKAQIYEVIAAAAARGKAIVMVSSYLPELFGLCDRLAVMSRGRLSPTRPIDEWTPEGVLHAALDTAAAEPGPVGTVSPGTPVTHG
jgi:ribose transport system ATP-binding protein